MEKKRVYTSTFEKVCEVCGKTFHSYKSNAKTCSGACRKMKCSQAKEKRFKDQGERLKEQNKELKRFNKKEKRFNDQDKELKRVEVDTKKIRYIISHDWLDGGCLNCGSDNVGILHARNRGYYVHCNDCYKDIDREEYIQKRYND